MLRKLSYLVCIAACCATSCSKSKPDPFSVKDWIDQQRKDTPQYTGPKVRLDVQFTPGSYTLTDTVETKQQIVSRDEERSTEERVTLAGDVEISRPDRSRGQTVRYTCRRVQQTSSARGGTQSYDSAGPADKQPKDLAAILAPLVGWQATVRVRDGKYTKVEGLDSLVAKLSESLPPGTAKQVVPKLQNKMQTFLKHLLVKHWGKLMPAQAVGPGDTWDVQISVPAVPFLGDTTFDCTCLLQDIEEVKGSKVAILAFASTAVVKAQTVDLSMLGPMPLQGEISKMEFITTGTAHFDLGVGLCTKTAVEMKGQGRMLVRGPKNESAKWAFSIQAKAENTLTPQPATSGTE